MKPCFHLKLCHSRFITDHIAGDDDVESRDAGSIRAINPHQRTVSVSLSAAFPVLCLSFFLCETVVII